jgi:hypothetical protein
MSEWTGSSSKKNTKGQYAHEETFNILNHKGNENQNNAEIPSPTSQNGYHQENKQQMQAQMPMGWMWKKNLLDPVSGNVD